MLELVIQLPHSVPILRICQLLDNALRDILAAWTFLDELDSEVDDVGASSEAAGARVEDVESPVKPQHPSLDLGTRSPPPSQCQPAARIRIPHPVHIFLINTSTVERYSQITGPKCSQMLSELKVLKKQTNEWTGK